MTSKILGVLPSHAPSASPSATVNPPVNPSASIPSTVPSHTLTYSPDLQTNTMPNLTTTIIRSQTSKVSLDPSPSTSWGDSSSALREIFLACDSTSLGTCNFEDFQPADLQSSKPERRSRSRSKRSHKGRHCLCLHLLVIAREAVMSQTPTSRFCLK